MPGIKFLRLHTDAILPEYKTEGAAGADVAAVENVDIPPGQVRAVNLGFAVSIPSGYEIQVRPRSGLALNHSVTVLNTPGTVDSDYRGPMKVILANFGEKTFFVSKGDRIAQLVVNKVEQGYFIEVGNLGETARGTGGFGSTGRN